MAIVTTASGLQYEDTEVGTGAEAGKGQQVTVAGNVTEREWTDKEGQTRKTMSIRVIDIALQGGRPGGEQPAPRQQRAAQPAQGGGFEDMDSDIPF